MMSVSANRAKGSFSPEEIALRAIAVESSDGLSSEAWARLHYMVTVATEAKQKHPRQYLCGEMYVRGLPYALSVRVQATLLVLANSDDVDSK